MELERQLAKKHMMHAVKERKNKRKYYVEYN